MRKLFTVIAILLFYCTASAQDKLLVAEGTPTNLYITHTVAPKENYYSIGRMYNTSPKELAPYNNLSFEGGLALGQTIRIPLGPSNFTQGEAPKENEVLVPVYHIMQPKEGLYRVSTNYNKVPLDALKKWNRLSGDAVGAGTKLIVGFLKVARDQSPLASQAMRIDLSEFAVKKPEDKKPSVKTQEVKTQEQPVIKSRQLTNEFGAAAIFKTTSGWQDGKYYCFHNTAEPGTIIKVTNNANGKSVYAKVLDAIPDIKQNSGLLLRISNSAADELGVTDTKFDCSISYAK
jgi:LysM repeat protein